MSTCHPIGDVSCLLAGHPCLLCVGVEYLIKDQVRRMLDGFCPICVSCNSVSFHTVNKMALTGAHTSATGSLLANNG